MIGLLLAVNLFWILIIITIRKLESKLPTLKRIKNKSKHFAAKDYYWLIYFKNKPYLFIDSELEKAQERAEKNKEDYE